MSRIANLFLEQTQVLCEKDVDAQGQVNLDFVLVPG